MLSEKTTLGIKDVRLELGADDTKHVVKVADAIDSQHSHIFFKPTKYHLFSSRDRKSSEKDTELPLPLAFSAFGWCFSLLATVMMVFVLFLLVFLIYETINNEGKADIVGVPHQSQIEIIMFK